MDNAEPYDLVTVLMRLQGLEGMAHEIGRHSTNDLGVSAAADAGRTGFFRMLVAKLRGRAIRWGSKRQSTTRDLGITKNEGDRL
jgi:hypothetical protein